MPLFELAGDELIPFRRVPTGPDLYEREIEEVLWANPGALTGVELFPVQRQAKVWERPRSGRKRRAVALANGSDIRFPGAPNAS